MSKRDEFIEKYDRNFQMIEEFIFLYTKQLESKNNWDLPAFEDSPITNRQYLAELNRVSDIEYSANQRQAIRTVEIQEHFFDEYIANLDTQYYSLLKLKGEIILYLK
jgi:hypothetical protein